MQPFSVVAKIFLKEIVVVMINVSRMAHFLDRVTCPKPLGPSQLTYHKTSRQNLAVLATKIVSQLSTFQGAGLYSS